MVEPKDGWTPSESKMPVWGKLLIGLGILSAVAAVISVAEHFANL